MLIKSASNDRIKEIKKLLSTPKLRREKGLYVVEGNRMFREIPQDELEQIIVAESKVDMVSDAEDNSQLVIVSDHIFSTLSDTVNPQGILALVRQRKYKFEDILINRSMTVTGQNDELSLAPIIFVLERIQDPGNLGTMLRTAEAVGASLMLSPDCADIYNPKVVRSTMGAIFRVPFYVSRNLSGDIDRLREKNICVYGTHLSGTEFYDNDFSKPSAFLIGNEGNGLSDEISAKADKLIKIPMLGKVESLNAATTVAVVGYETMRQRR